MPSSTYFPPPPRPRASSSSSSIPRSAASGSSSRAPLRSAGVGHMDEEPEDEWDSRYSGFLNAPQAKGTPRRSKGRKKRDEPMKPTTVILYVVVFYIIWQILTRSTDTEILSHLSPSSPHHYHASSHLPESGQSQTPYHIPYGFPHLPSPLPAQSSSNGNPDSSKSPSTTRWILGYLFYPFYLLLLPIMNIVSLVLYILAILLFPLTSTGQILLRIFVVTPYTWARAVGAAVYPVYVFVGGMVGVGCVMGLGAGWAGRKCLDWAVGGRSAGDDSKESRGYGVSSGSKAASKAKDFIDESGYRTSRHSDLQYRSQRMSSTGSSNSKARRQSSASSNESVPPGLPRTPTRNREYLMMAPTVYPQDSVSRRGGEARDRGKGKERTAAPASATSAREGQVVGTRRRTVRYEDE